MHLTHTVDIGAPASVVWRLTLDIERWPEFTPTITTVAKLSDGPIAAGTRARIKQPGLRPAVWVVTEVTPATRFRWETNLLGSRFIATHIIEPTAAGCRNRVELDVVGWTAPLLAILAGARLRQVLEIEGAGFKRAAERSAE